MCGSSVGGQVFLREQTSDTAGINDGSFIKSTALLILLSVVVGITCWVRMPVVPATGRTITMIAGEGGQKPAVED